MDTGLKDRVVIVTGANHGIGAAIARAFAREGARVLIHYKRIPPDFFNETTENMNRAERPGRAYYCRKLSQSAGWLVDEIKSSGGRCAAIEKDLAIAGNIPLIFDYAEKKLGHVDVLVNNAAHDLPDSFIPGDELKKNPFFVDEYPLETISPGSVDNHFAVNSRAVALMMAEYSRRLIARKSRWGRIINISTDGAAGHAANVSYGASKWAMESYSRAAAVELGTHGITVNVVSPGAVQTGWMPLELEKNLSESYPMKRVGKPEDIASAVIFFASDQADWVTGQVLYVGGGNRM